MAGMEITTNIGCRVACAYCPQDRIAKSYAKRSDILQMSFGTFKTCLDKIPEEVIIHFSGMCEGWLNPECTNMAIYAHKKGHKIGAFTTLTGMSLSDVGLLEYVPFLYFCVHLPSDKGNENIRVDEGYLQVLEKVSKSRIDVSYVVLEGDVHPKPKSVLKGKDIVLVSAHTRSKNIKFDDRPAPAKKSGLIGCALELRSNILLPNGDVVLCCMDYGMQVVLGNLLRSDYSSLFKGEEFLRVREGLRDGSSDILCRYCEEYAYKVNMFTRVWFPLKYWLKRFSGLKTLFRFLRRPLRKFSA